MKMPKLAMALLTALVAVSSLVLWSCASEPQLSDSDIEKAFVKELPTFTSVSSFSVEAKQKQNLGTNVVNIWQARIRATITVASDTFALENENSDENSEVTFVRPVKLSGESVEVFGTSVSKLYAGAWRTTVELERQPIATLGYPLSAFGNKKVIARGSQEEKQYLADKQNAGIIEGTISGYECEEMCDGGCYLTITDKEGKDHRGSCWATLCTKWNYKEMMPDSYKGKRVKVTVDVDGVGAFTKIQFLKP